MSHNFSFVWASIRHYWRPCSGVISGAALGTAVLTGALLVGTSIEQSLINIAAKRLGQTQYALSTNERFIRSELAREIGQATQCDITPVLVRDGALNNPEAENNLQDIQIYGVDPGYWEFRSGGAQPPSLTGNRIAINQQVSRSLGLDVGSYAGLRISRSSAVPMETPIAHQGVEYHSFPVIVEAILSDEQMGRFDLRSSQSIPRNIFIDRSYLVEKLALRNDCNLLLAKSAESSGDISPLTAALQTKLQLSDLDLELRYLPHAQQYELRSSSIFFPPHISRELMASQLAPQSIFTYFINDLAHNNYSVPYSFISGLDTPPFNELHSREIIINQWLAEQLAAQTGDSLQMTWYEIDKDNQLYEDSRRFQIVDIVSMSAAPSDSTLMPAFTGLAGSNDCSEWHPGIPIDLERIRKEDEAYWDMYGGTPKAFVSLATARELWQNRFGDLTAMRFPGQMTEIELSEEIVKLILPLTKGLSFQDVRQQALIASTEGVDFGQLFISLSFFIIFAALMLTGLLFVFNLDQRRFETNRLLEIGFPRRRILQLRLVEGLVLAIPGALLGCLIGLLYSQYILKALSTIWQDAVRFDHIEMAADPVTIALGGCLGVVAAMAAISMTVVQQFRQHRTQKSGRTPSSKKRETWISGIGWAAVFIILVLIVVLVTRSSPETGQNMAASFYVSGTLLLLGGMLAAGLFLKQIRLLLTSPRMSECRLIALALAQRRGRNLTVSGMMACGLFIVFAVGAHHKSADTSAQQLSAGTGGFELLADLPLALLPQRIHELNTKYLDKENGFSDRGIIPLRVRRGEDASCLNLTRTTQPQILGVDPHLLEGAFSFTGTWSDLDLTPGWEILNMDLRAGFIPAIADQTVIQWGLGLTLGDTLLYHDDHGQQVGLVLVAGLANSIFQGNLLIAENPFVQHFPDHGGYGFLLIDTSKQNPEPLLNESLWAVELSSTGAEFESAAQRLADFNAVENTYLTIFLMLGGLGLFIGTFGLGVTVLRNILERRSELALLKALGFKNRRIFRILFIEHLIIFIWGLVLGIASAFVAILPSLQAPGAELSLKFIMLLILGMLVNGLWWIWLAVKSSISKELLSPLRQE